MDGTMVRKADRTSTLRSAPAARRGATRRNGHREAALTGSRAPLRDGGGTGGLRVERGVGRTCLALVRHRTQGSRRAPRPAALGFKLVSGALPAAEVAALCAAVRSELARAGDAPRWAAPGVLHALLVEYRAVRHTFRTRARRPHRPIGCD